MSKKLRRSLIVLLFVLGTCAGVFKFTHTASVHAQSSPATTQFGTITDYQAGWTANVVMVETSAPYVDNGCNNTTTTQYSTLDGVEGNPAFHAALLSALLSGRQVAITVQGCASGHPQIIGVKIKP